MKLRHIRGGIFVLSAWVVFAQAPSVTPPASGPGAGSAPVGKAAAESDCPLCFKPAPGQTPPPPPVEVPRPTAPAPGPAVIDNEPPAAPPRTAAAPAAAPVASAPAKTVKPYVIGPLDVLEIKVWNNANLSTIADVRTDGMISMPLVGEVNASGMTVPELVGVIKNKLNEVIIEPEVNIQVVRYNSKKYSIFGGCARQGDFPLVGEVTVLDAFANCGGFKDFANLKKIYILRGQEKFRFNYKDVIRGKHMEQNIALENGDRIVIPE